MSSNVLSRSNSMEDEDI